MMINEKMVATFFREVLVTKTKTTDTRSTPAGKTKLFPFIPAKQRNEKPHKKMNFTIPGISEIRFFFGFL